MKRLFGAILIAILGVSFFLTYNASAASTNNFRITSFDIQYELSRDSEGRSVLKTTELITAKFSNFNQNHGLERAIPHSYDGHSVSLKVEEATNTDGNDQHSISTSNDMTIIRIGDPDEYVHGEQTYRIVYMQRDVTKLFDADGRDEWYWDTNGTQWRVPIDTLSISIKVASDIANERVGTPFCYFGREGANDRCEVMETGAGTYKVNLTNVDAGENATVAFGFEPGTFAAYKMSAGDIFLMVWGIIQIASIPLMIAGIIGLSIMYYRRSNRVSETHSLVAEYIPPRDASVMASSQVITAGGSAFTAQLIDLAVRHYISIVETRAKSTWKAAEYDIIITSDPATLFSEEQEILSDMFGSLPKVGDRLALKSLVTNMPYTSRTADNTRKLLALVRKTYGLRAKDSLVAKAFYRWAIGIGIFAVVLLSIPLALVAGIAAILGASIWPLTDKGLALRRYVLGLDRYVKAAETERLKFLQGPDTAQKVGYDIDPSNPGQIVKLYERVLPYAILFGREKEWSSRLGGFYEKSGTSPDWYTGSTTFNAVVFASAMSSFSMASGYSAGSNSGSSGSSGGGSSGGGGGGGGGGGW